MLTIFDIKRFALHDGPGIRTTVFLKGCPLRCKWCHNPESQSMRLEEYVERKMLDGKEIEMVRVYGKRVEKQELLEEILKDRVFYQESEGGVTFSGGEPILQADELIGLLTDLGNHGIHRTMDTCGFIPLQQLKKAAAETELFLYDLKFMDPGLHIKYTGVDNELILKNAEWLLQSGAKVIFRIPVLPGVNDTPEETEQFLGYLSARREKIAGVHLLPYHHIGSDKYRRLEMEYTFADVEEPGDKRMQELKKEFESTGIPVSIGG